MDSTKFIKWLYITYRKTLSEYFRLPENTKAGINQHYKRYLSSQKGGNSVQ